MPTAIPTVDELVATIKRSLLPTVLVEGKDDTIIYRWMESRFRNPSVDFLPCNSRSVVLSLFERRHEFAQKAVAFIADKDMWVFGSPPPQYAEVIFTGGYSIENDVLSCRAADALFDPDEKCAFDCLLHVLEEWFAFEASEHLANRRCVLDVPLRKIVDVPSYQLSASFIATRGYVPKTGPLREDIRADPLKYIRGKNLLAAYTHLLHKDGREAQYSPKAILEVCVKLPAGHSHCDLMVRTVRERMRLG